MRQPQTGGKSTGGTPKAVAAAKKAAAKPKKATASGVSIRKIETSPTIKYSGKPRVSQTTIDNIKKLGMTAALKKAGTSKNVEYLEGIRRMYGANRLAAAKKAATPKVAKRTFSPAQKKAMKRGM